MTNHYQLEHHLPCMESVKVLEVKLENVLEDDVNGSVRQLLSYSDSYSRNNQEGCPLNGRGINFEANKTGRPSDENELAQNHQGNL